MTEIDIANIAEIVQCRIKEKDHQEQGTVITTEEIQKIESTTITTMILIQITDLILVIASLIKGNLYTKGIENRLSKGNHLALDCTKPRKRNNKEGKRHWKEEEGLLKNIPDPIVEREVWKEVKIEVKNEVDQRNLKELVHPLIVDYIKLLKLKK